MKNYKTIVLYISKYICYFLPKQFLMERCAACVLTFYIFSLIYMTDIEIVCGPVDGDESQTELVCIQWVQNDTDFNVG